jgi:hypothetical protein|tara:strand:- start:1142 stop:1585 length:444 start_codon:yes stop_codon:yes gene_type:complete
MGNWLRIFNEQRRLDQMSFYSSRSRNRLYTCHPVLQIIMEKAIQSMDLTILCGIRSESEQKEAVRLGHSYADFPDSAHNVISEGDSSRAVDAAPFPIDWNNKLRFYEMGALVLGIASEMGFKLRWGGHFKKRNGELFFDGVHFELIE